MEHGLELLLPPLQLGCMAAECTARCKQACMGAVRVLHGLLVHVQLSMQVLVLELQQLHLLQQAMQRMLRGVDHQRVLRLRLPLRLPCCADAVICPSCCAWPLPLWQQQKRIASIAESSVARRCCCHGSCCHCCQACARSAAWRCASNAHSRKSCNPR